MTSIRNVANRAS